MFRESSYHTLDNKGRLIIPARFREVIKANGGDKVMVTGMDGCLLGYPIDDWRKLESKILAMAQKGARIRRFRRVFIGGAAECNCDKQGRILISQPLREYANLGKEIALVGVLDHFEIWRRERWDRERATLDKDMISEGGPDEIAKLGI